MNLVTELAPLHLGFRYGTQAVDWLEDVMPGLHTAIKKSEGWFRRASTLAVAVEPGAAVCLLAGSARMQPGWFAAINVLGTVARLAVIRLAGSAAGSLIHRVLDTVQRFRLYVLLVTVAVALASAVPIAGALIGLWRKARVGPAEVKKSD